jgi:hypothetical protein
MAEKKINRKRNWMPTVILLFALVSIALIVVDVSVNLSETGIFVDPGDTVVETIAPIPPEPSLNVPTPTIEPVQGA